MASTTSGRKKILEQLENYGMVTVTWLTIRVSNGSFTITSSLSFLTTGDCHC